MKKLLALIAIIGIVPCAYGAEGADFSQSGEFRLQYIHDNNLTFNSGAGVGKSDQIIEQRLRWGTTVRAGEKLTGHFTLVHNANWGSNPSQVPNTVTVPDSATPAADTISQAGTNNLLVVNEAYMSWMASDALMIRAGRGTFTMADGKLVSANEYEQVWNAFDGAMVSYDHEMLRASVFAVKGGTAATTNGNTTDNNIARFYGVSVDVKTLPDFLKMVNLHYVALRQDEGDYSQTGLSPAGLDPIPGESSNRFGAAISGDKMGIDYHATYESYSGTRTSSTAFASGSNSQSISSSMIDAEVGYTLPATMNLRVHAGYHTDTGTSGGSDDNTYQGFYYDRHNNGGYMSVVSWGNLTYTDLGVTLQPIEDITVGATYYMMTKTQANDANYTGTGKLVGAGGVNTGNVAIAADTNGGSNKLGNELDVWATKKYTNNFNISARYSMFSAGQAIKDMNNGSGDTRSQIYLESKLTF